MTMAKDSMHNNAMDTIKSTSVTIASEYGSITVTVPKADMTIDELFEQAIIPALLGAGYSQKVIDGYLNGEPED